VIGETLLDRYFVEAQLGEGGMGVVYRAVDERGQPVAIKLLHAAVAASPELAARFQREATAHAMLSHPNIAALHAVGVTDKREMFFVLEYIEGHDLATELERGPLERRRSIELTKQLLSGLHHAHQFGMVHRDLKPENILLARTGPGAQVNERVKLIDFGLVKLLTDVLGEQECQRLTRTGMVFGTPQYMSPEQIRGEPVDARSDLYAVGIVLFEMLTGRRPFEHEEITQLWTAHLYAPVPRLREHGGPDDPELDAILATLLGKSPEQRFAAAHAARRALDSLA
jgi:serine/threonine-protein kinase